MLNDDYQLLYKYVLDMYKETPLAVIISLAIIILIYVCMCMIFKKAGRKWWEFLIPGYNIVVLLQILSLPIWFIAFNYIPFRYLDSLATMFLGICIYINLARAFGKKTSYVLLLIFFPIIVLPILAFGKSTYTQPAKLF